MLSLDRKVAELGRAAMCLGIILTWTTSVKSESPSQPHLLSVCQWILPDNDPAVERIRSADLGVASNLASKPADLFYFEVVKATHSVLEVRLAYKQTSGEKLSLDGFSDMASDMRSQIRSFTNRTDTSQKHSIRISSNEIADPWMVSTLAPELNSGTLTAAIRYAYSIPSFEQTPFEVQTLANGKSLVHYSIISLPGSVWCTTIDPKCLLFLMTVPSELPDVVVRRFVAWSLAREKVRSENSDPMRSYLEALTSLGSLSKADLNRFRAPIQSKQAVVLLLTTTDSFE